METNPEKEPVVDLESLLRNVGCSNPETVLNVYLNGSKAYGYATESSDMDFIMIAEPEMSGRKWSEINWFFQIPKTEHALGVLKNTKRDFFGREDFQVWIYTPQSFQDLISLYVPFAIECLFLPKANVWKASKEFSLPNPIDKKAFRDAYLSVANAHIERAKQDFKDKQDGVSARKIDLYKTKKILFHGLRILEFGCEILEKGSIYDFTAVASLKQQLVDISGEDFESHERFYLPIYLSYKQRLENLCGS